MEHLSPSFDFSNDGRHLDDFGSRANDRNDFMSAHPFSRFETSLDAKRQFISLARIPAPEIYSFRSPIAREVTTENHASASGALLIER
jgi:hypothetical protein